MAAWPPEASPAPAPRRAVPGLGTQAGSSGSCSVYPLRISPCGAEEHDA